MTTSSNTAITGKLAEGRGNKLRRQLSQQSNTDTSSTAPRIGTERQQRSFRSALMLGVPSANPHVCCSEV
ncbi:hypothetical protein V496_04626 [Pseudogymnoascus sp. VKM F-4515 (FW-2607)]|nr:hypothetical protein V496_04626 [Pseudogymnoascus sp. VKM F-4515 (FW-2607)]